MLVSELLYIKKVKINQIPFGEKIISIAGLLGINPNWLMFIINFESAGTFSPSIMNGSGSGGCGLIQFMPNTAIGLGTSIAALKAMSNVEQLDYVYKYFKPFKGRYKTIEDMYLVTFYPYALGKPDTYVIGSEKSLAWSQKVAQQNKVLDVNKDGTITLGEWKNALYLILKARLGQAEVDNWLKKKVA